MCRSPIFPAALSLNLPAAVVAAPIRKLKCCPATRDISAQKKRGCFWIDHQLVCCLLWLCVRHRGQSGNRQKESAQ